MAIANVVLNTKTYAYASDQAGVILWRDVSGGIPTGYPTLTMSLTSPNKSDIPYRASAALRIPVVATADSDCKCTGELLRYWKATINVEAPQTGTTAERLDGSLQLRDLAANAQWLAMIQNLVRPG